MRTGRSDAILPRERAARRCWWTLVAAIASSLAANGIARGADAPLLRVRMARSPHELALRRAAEGVNRRLARAECRRIFTDFVDQLGRPLQERLDTLGMTGQQFMGFMGFYEGAGHGRCVSGGVLAFTQPGSLAVRVCPGIAEQTPEWAEYVVLHEMLHSLGLGENPPSSSAITRQVEARCGGG